MKKLTVPSIKKFTFDMDKEDDDDEPTTSLEELETIESQELKGKLVECKFCDGSGKVSKSNNLGILSVGRGEKKPCPACGGSGYKRV